MDIERLLSLAGKSTVDVGKIEFYGELVGIDGVEMVQVREGKNDGEEKVLSEFIILMYSRRNDVSLARYL